MAARRNRALVTAAALAAAALLGGCGSPKGEEGGGEALEYRGLQRRLEEQAHEVGRATESSGAPPAEGAYGAP